MNEIFEDFSSLLELRLTSGIQTTEDSVRYTLFAAMLRGGIQPHDIVLEYSHPAISRAQVDTWLPSLNGHSVGIEFKYDRNPPGGKNQPKTQKAGQVFRDVHRLVLLGENTRADCYFVYVTTEEMAVYFKNSSNGYHDFFGLMPGAKFEIRSGYFSEKPTTFTNSLGGEFEASIESVLSMPLPVGHHLRIFKVSPA
jgi:hypothetical protein